MVLPNVDFLSGLTSLEIVVSGYILGFILIFKHARKAPTKELRNQIILRGLGIITVFHSWFGSTAGFVLISLGFPPLGRIAHVLSYSWGPALGGVIWAYIASDLVKEGRYKIPVTVIVAILSLIFFILVYIFPLQNTSYTPSEESGLPSSGFSSTAMALLGLILVIMGVALGPSVIYTGLKMEDKSAKWRRYSMGSGLMMVSLIGIIDAAVSSVPIIALAMIKAFIFTSVFLIYEGVDKGT